MEQRITALGSRTTVATHSTKRCLTCECGFSVTAGDLDDLIEAAKHHAKRAHHMTMSAAQLAALAVEIEDDGRSRTSESRSHTDRTTTP